MAITTKKKEVSTPKVAPVEVEKPKSLWRLFAEEYAKSKRLSK